MDTVLAQDIQSERGRSHSRRSLGRYQRLFFMLLIALAFFGAVSAASSREAEAAGTGYYWTTHNGQNFECWWVYYGNDTWWEEGCKVYYGGAANPVYYEMIDTGETWVSSNGGPWVRLNNYWQNSEVASTVDFYSNRVGYDHYGIQGVSFSIDDFFWGVSSYGTYEDSRTSEASGAPQAPPPSDAAQPSEATQSPETSTDSRVTSAAFPWKVCQDDGGCFKYSGSTWNRVTTSNAQGGSYRVGTSKTQGAFFAAQGPTDAGGSTMQLITGTGPKMGKAKVHVVNLATAKRVKTVTFDLKTSTRKYKVVKSITGLTPHKPYGIIVLSADGLPVTVDAVGYEAHGNMCHNVL